MSFLTAGEDEVRAWTIPMHTVAPKAAGAIHSDFEKKFIRAEVGQLEGAGGSRRLRRASKRRDSSAWKARSTSSKTATSLVIRHG